MSSKLSAWYLAHPSAASGTVWNDLVRSANGTITSSAASGSWWSTDSPTAIAQSVAFDGSSTRVQLTRVWSKELPGGISPRTLLVWVKVNGFTGTSAPIFNAGFNAEFEYWSLSVDAATSRLQVSRGGSTPILIGTTAIDDQWHCVCVVYDGNRGHKLYLDGVLEAETEDVARHTMFFGSTVGYLGREGTNYLNGNISDVRLYAEALTPEAISQYMADSIAGYSGLYPLPPEHVWDPLPGIPFSNYLYYVFTARTPHTIQTFPGLDSDKIQIWSWGSNSSMDTFDLGGHWSGSEPAPIYIEEPSPCVSFPTPEDGGFIPLTSYTGIWYGVLGIRFRVPLAGTKTLISGSEFAWEDEVTVLQVHEDGSLTFSIGAGTPTEVLLQGPAGTVPDNKWVTILISVQDMGDYQAWRLHSGTTKIDEFHDPNWVDPDGGRTHLGANYDLSTPLSGGCVDCLITWTTVGPMSENDEASVLEIGQWFLDTTAPDPPTPPPPPVVWRTATGLAPGQSTVIPFTMAEAPDALPTVSGYKVPATGGLVAVDLGAEVFSVPGRTLAYYVTLTIPANAVVGERYLLLATVTVSGQDLDFWFSCGDIGQQVTLNLAGLGLTTEQATHLASLQNTDLAPVTAAISGLSTQVDDNHQELLPLVQDLGDVEQKIDTHSTQSETEHQTILDKIDPPDPDPGSGSVIVDHDWGAEDNLLVVTGDPPTPVEGAIIRAFLTSDWDAGNKSLDFVQGETRTGADGRWSWPLMLDPGAWTLSVFKPQELGVQVVSITVP